MQNDVFTLSPHLLNPLPALSKFAAASQIETTNFFITPYLLNYYRLRAI